MTVEPHPGLSELLGLPTWHARRTGSTNDDAWQLAMAGAPHGSVILADAQDRGRGRLGRSWHSSPGENLTFSLVLRPDTRPAQTPLLTLAAGVALAEQLDLWLKWPNDLVDAQGRKVGGLLCELELREGRVLFVILGVGLNVNESAFPPELAAAASLAMLDGERREPAALLARLLPGLLERTGQLRSQREAVLAAWRRRSVTLGRQVQVGELRGFATDLRADGALLLRDAEGRVHAVVAGEVQLLHPAG